MMKIEQEGHKKERHVDYRRETMESYEYMHRG